MYANFWRLTPIGRRSRLYAFSLFGPGPQFFEFFDQIKRQHGSRSTVVQASFFYECGRFFVLLVSAHWFIRLVDVRSFLESGIADHHTGRFSFDFFTLVGKFRQPGQHIGHFVQFGSFQGSSTPLPLQAHADRRAHQMFGQFGLYVRFRHKSPFVVPLVRLD